MNKARLEIMKLAYETAIRFLEIAAEDIETNVSSTIKSLNMEGADAGFLSGKIEGLSVAKKSVDRKRISLKKTLEEISQIDA